MSKKWRVWLDRDLNAQWIECLEAWPLPPDVESLLAQMREALAHKPVILGPDFEIRVQV